MTEPIPFKPADPDERKERARESQDLLDNKAFTAAILALRKQWFGEMMVAGLTPDRVLEIRGRLQALEGIPQQLQIFVNDEKMAQAKKR